MEQDTEVTKVIFRQFKGDHHWIIALFPEIPGNADSSTCLCYMHFGQHGNASTDVTYITRPAHPSNYAALKEELESIGYKLQVVYRFTQAAREKRRAALKAMDSVKSARGESYEVQGIGTPHHLV